MNKIGVVIGRFQPFHQGHLEMVEKASSMCDHLLVIIGSADKQWTMKNPWTAEERKNNIQKILNAHLRNYSSVDIEFVPDHHCDFEWKKSIFLTAKDYAKSKESTDITLFGHMKEGNDYLNWFPGWDFTHIDTSFPSCATDIRKQMVAEKDESFPEEFWENYNFYQKEKGVFKDYPYPETLNFLTADALIVHNGDVLLIKRKNAPGRGLWALPGGYVNNNETTLQAVIREVKEETGIDVGNVYTNQNKFFDNPNRGMGIPRRTMVYEFDFEDYPRPTVTPLDDASEARWFSLIEYFGDSNKYLPMFEDHREIIQSFYG